MGGILWIAIINSSVLSFVQFGKEGVGLFSFSLFPSFVLPVCSSSLQSCCNFLKSDCWHGFVKYFLKRTVSQRLVVYRPSFQQAVEKWLVFIFEGERGIGLDNNNSYLKDLKLKIAYHISSNECLGASLSFSSKDGHLFEEGSLLHLLSTN